MGNTLYGYTLAESEYQETVPTLYGPAIRHEIVTSSLGSQRYCATCGHGGCEDGEPEVIIAISAHGGGTVGESYADNGWDYSVYVNGAELISGCDLRSGGMPKTHAETARTLAAFLAHDGETLYSRSLGRRVAPDTEPTATYAEDAAEFLISEYERLGLFSADLV